MTDTAELETDEPPIGQATIIYLGPTGPIPNTRSL